MYELIVKLVLWWNKHLSLYKKEYSGTMVLKIISFSWNQGIRAVLHFFFFEWKLFICCCRLSTGCCWPSAVAAGYQPGAVDPSAVVAGYQPSAVNPVMLLQGIKLVLLTRCCCCRISINRVLLTQCSCCRVSTTCCWPSAVVQGIKRVLLTQCCCCRESTGCCWSSAVNAGYQPGAVDTVLLLQVINRVLLT